VAVNSFLRPHHMDKLPEYLERLAQIDPHALILSDPGVFALARQYAPNIPIHISTQANVTNGLSARFWHEAGASRIILARELSLDEVAGISRSEQIETEIFIHGAMCISYSGRCLLSSIMTDRSANLGSCSHPCRYKYTLEEEKRSGEHFPIEEDVRGSYIMNSRDLCLLEYIPKLCTSGIASLKIEGRNKSAYYVANCVRVYRAALDAWAADPEKFALDPLWMQELEKVSHRGYTDAFAQGQAGSASIRSEHGGYIRGYDFAAIAHEAEGNRLWLEQRNYFAAGDELELILADGRNIALPVNKMQDEDGEPITVANHPKQRVSVEFPFGGELPLPLLARKISV